MRPLNPSRPIIRGIVNESHPYWSVILELRHLGYSLDDISQAFNWHGPVTGLGQLCHLFPVDMRDRRAQLSEQPLWNERRSKLVDLSTKSSLSPDDERLRHVLSSLLGEYLATIERCQYIADPELPAVLPAELEGARLLLDCCLNSACMPDAPPASLDGHLFMLRSFVQYRCDYFLGQPLRSAPLHQLELAVSVGF